MIDTPAQLRDLITHARRCRRVALDTEFVWERTYYPNLGLVQLALDRDETFLIDAVRLDDLTPLGDLLADPDVVKVLHDAQQDLTILRRATGGAPKNVFDTRLAGGFVGLTATSSLQGLIEATVGVHLPKGESRSDWLRRPLSDAQLTYARDDVRYLTEAYDELRERVRGLGREAWVEEEMAQFDAPALYEEDDPYVRYRSVKGRGKRGFSARDYAVLRELTAWREQEARRANRPRGHIVRDDVLVEFARRKPTTVGEIGAVQGISDKALRRYGPDLAAAVERGLGVPKAERPQPPTRSRVDDAELARFDLAQALLKGRSLRANLDPVLVSNRAGVERLVIAGPDAVPSEHALLRGWRSDFVGEALLEILRGNGAVTVDPATDLPRFSGNGHGS